MQPTTYHFSGDINVDEDRGYTQGYLDFPFEVPEGAGQLKMMLAYTPLQVGAVQNLVTLGLFDPSSNFRGNAHRHPPDQEVLISAKRATPGFTPGPLPPGRWLAQLAIQAVVATDPGCHFQLDIEVQLTGDDQPGSPHHAWVEQRLTNPPGWYCGELHSHTLHSDGSLPSAELVKQARQSGLDFLAVTDHNTHTALAEIDPSSLGNMLLIPGIELTTFAGHALVLGVNGWIDWRTGYEGWTMEDAAKAARDAGGLFIVAHPGAIGSPVCTGCQWEYADFNLDLADGYEVWNGPSQDPTDQNPKALAMWQALQADGRRIPATGGSDYHGLSDWREGTPRAYIYAQSLTIPAILDGIRQGRLYISSGPKLSFQVRASGSGLAAGIGDTLIVKEGRIEVLSGWEGAAEGTILVMRNEREPILTIPIADTGSREDLVQAGSQDRFWIEVYDPEGVLVAITNPVFISKGLDKE